MQNENLIFETFTIKPRPGEGLVCRILTMPAPYSFVPKATSLQHPGQTYGGQWLFNIIQEMRRLIMKTVFISMIIMMLSSVAYANELSKSFCERVNSAKDAAIAITGVGAGVVGGASATASAAGVTAVTHSSGAVILTGSGGYIAGTLASIGATSLAVLTAPVTMTAAAVSVATVGGAVYYCKE